MTENHGTTAFPGRKVDLEPPPEVRRITRVLEEAGFATWAVGGAVRDALAGLSPGDWDLTTAARPRDVQRLFRRTVPIGVDHGTVGVLGKDGQLYEVTTFRRDVETFGRRARVAFSDTLEADLERRDFTINAVAWHPITGEVRDPHGGARDLRDGILRTVGEPAHRFAEDRLRVLRALRFAGRFRLHIHHETWNAIRDSADQLGNLSAERIREELFKILRGLTKPSTALQLYADSGVLRHLYPALDACLQVREPDGTSVWAHQLQTTDLVPRHRLVLRIAALLHDIGKPQTLDLRGGAPSFPDHAAVGATLAAQLLRRLKASNAEIDRVMHLVAQHAGLPAPEAGEPEVRRWVRQVGREHLPDLLRLRAADVRARGGDPAAIGALVRLARRVRKMLTTQPPLGIGDLAISGAELRTLGLPPGPVFGEILRDLLEVVTDDPSLNQRETLIDIVRQRLSSRESD